MKLFNEQQLQSKIEENKIKISSKADFFRSYALDHLQINYKLKNLPNVNSNHNKW